MTITVGELGELARGRGVHPAALLDGLERAIEDDARINSEGVAQFQVRGRGDIPLPVEVVEDGALR